jgi:ketosteroid isomerase-like protein
MTSDDRELVLAAVGSFARAFAKADGERLWRLWDKSYPRPAYMPEEILHPLLDADAIRAYFMNLPTVIRGVTDISPIDLQLDVLGEFAHVFARATATLTFVRGDVKLSGEVRQSFVLRKNDTKWLFIHYHESRLTPGLEELVK